MNKAESIVETMYSRDEFSRWLGIKREEISEGSCVLSLSVRSEMLNGFKIAHGGITYSLADSALAFASNSSGIKSVSIETSISHLASVQEGDLLTARAKEIKRGRKTAWYEVRVTNQHQELVAIFKGTVYRTDKEWEF